VSDRNSKHNLNCNRPQNKKTIRAYCLEVGLRSAAIIIRKPKVAAHTVGHADT